MILTPLVARFPAVQCNQIILRALLGRCLRLFQVQVRKENISRTLHRWYIGLWARPWKFRKCFCLRLRQCRHGTCWVFLHKNLWVGDFRPIFHGWWALRELWAGSPNQAVLELARQQLALASPAELRCWIGAFGFPHLLLASELTTTHVLPPNSYISYSSPEIQHFSPPNSWAFSLDQQAAISTWHSPAPKPPTSSSKYW